MKKLIFSALLLGLVSQGFAQDVIYEAKIKKEQVPAVIVSAVETDFPDFVMEDFYAVPLEFIEDDVVINKNLKSVDDYDSYEVTLASKGRTLTATYTAAGKLMSTTEHVKNFTPSAAVRNSIAKAYPGWTIAKDSYNYTHYGKGKARERYKLELTKGSEKMHVYTDANGKILKKSRDHKKRKV